MGSSCLQHMGVHVSQLQQKRFYVISVSLSKQTWTLGVTIPAVSATASAFRSRGSTHRSQSQPMGSNVGVTYDHNVMVGRVIVLLCLCWAKGIWWMMEQPKGSLLEGHVLFQAMLKLKHVAVTRTTCSLGWFGADTLKPIWIYSSISAKLKKRFDFCNSFGHLFPIHLYGLYLMHRFQSYCKKRFIWKVCGAINPIGPSCSICQHRPGRKETGDITQFENRSLELEKSTEMVVKYTDSNGVERIKGGSGLKDSQAYPKMFPGFIFQV